MDIEITMRAKAFTNEGVRTHRVLVDSEDLTVRVWDSPAGYYTTCHCLCSDAIRRAIREALQWRIKIDEGTLRRRFATKDEADAYIERRELRDGVAFLE